jgi:glycosyltransferase involved in cell wall biosynthesis
VSNTHSSNPRPRVLLLSKALVVGIYQRKLEEMARLGIDLLALTPPSWKDERGETHLERVYTSGYRLETIPIALNGNFHLHWYPGLAGRIRDFQPQIIHIDEEPYNLATWQALRVARQISAKTLIFSWQNIRRVYPPPFSWGEGWTLSQVDHVLAGTQSAAHVWRAKGYAGPLTVIPQFGVDPDLFAPILSPLSPADLGAGVRTFTMGYVGRLVEEKGIHLLLMAAARLDGEWRLRLVGSGPYWNALASLAQQLGIRDRLDRIEWVESAGMPLQYQQIDVLVIPSLTRLNWKEQFGRVITEAMSSALPVIGSDSGAIPDVMGSAGMIVPEGDIDSLTDALHRLRDDPVERARLGQAGRARVLAHFTHAQVATATVRVYEQLLGTPIFG